MGERLNRAQAAERQGVRRQRIDELIAEGKLTERNDSDGQGNYLDSDEIDAAWAGFDPDMVQRAALAKTLNGKGADKAADPNAAQGAQVARVMAQAKAKAQVLKANDLEMDLQIKRGMWVLREAVVQQAYTAANMLSHRLHAAVQQLAPQVCVITDPGEAQELLNRILIEGILVDYRNDLQPGS